MKEKLLSWLMVFGLILGIVVFVYSYRTMKEAQAYNFWYANQLSK